MIVAGVEDFGIAAVEARCCGCPMIAFSASGVAETFHEGVGGLLFDEQSVNSLEEALQRCIRSFLPGTVRKSTVETVPGKRHPILNRHALMHKASIGKGTDTVRSAAQSRAIPEEVVATSGRQIASKLTAEMMGTFALVFAGCGAIMVDATIGGTITHVGVAMPSAS